MNKIFLFLFVFNNCLAQNYSPTYICKATNFRLPALNQLEFDIYIQHTNSFPFNYTGGQYFFNFNNAISNGGTLSLAIVLSDLHVTLQPRNPQVFHPGGSVSQLRLAVNQNLGKGMYPINTGNPGTLIVRLRLSTTASKLANIPLGLQWRHGPTNPYTRIFASIAYVTTDVTQPENHLIDTIIIPRPQLVSPVNNSLNSSRIKLVWNKFQPAVSYEVRVYSDYSFTYTFTTKDTFIVAPSHLTFGFEVIWRVIAKDANYVNYYSDEWRFTLLPFPVIKLNIKVLIEGFYNPVSNIMSRSDTMKVYLRHIHPPYQIYDSAYSVIDSVSFSGLSVYNFIPSGYYYIVLKHFNSLETWNRLNGTMLLANGNINNYSFTDINYMTYDSNVKLVGQKYCIFSGDVDQNGIIDSSDFMRVNEDALNFKMGLRIETDLNGDNLVDATDLIIVENNLNTRIRSPLENFNFYSLQYKSLTPN